MRHLADNLPTSDSVLRQSAEKLAYEVLDVLSAWESHRLFELSRESFQAHALNDDIFTKKGYPQADHDEIRAALSSAWEWLTRTRSLVPDSRFPGGSVFKIGQAGRELLAKPRERRALGTLKIEKEALHLRLQRDAWGPYERAEFSTAVLAAMRAVEIAVREAAGLGAGDLGTNLMRAAFHPETGSLTDNAAEKGERQARSDLFTGAIGSYKNPSSHRDVDYRDPDEVVEILLLANHLLRIVDARKVALGR